MVISVDTDLTGSGFERVDSLARSFKQFDLPNLGNADVLLSLPKALRLRNRRIHWLTLHD
jgi:hypothetical protein